MTEEEWKSRVTTQLAGIDKRLRELEKAEAVDDVVRRGIDIRLQAIEDTLKWLVRLVIGGLLIGLISAIIQGGLLVP